MREEAPTRAGIGILRERIKGQRERRLMVDFAKFVTVQALDMTNLLTPEELLDAWLEQTFRKPAREDTMKLAQVGEPTYEYLPGW